MKHRDLNAPPAQQMADIVRSLKERAEASKTTAHGVKDMGETGDSTWIEPATGTFRSVRRFAVELDDTTAQAEALAERLADAEAELAAAEGRLDAAREALDRLDARVDVTALQVSRGPLPPAGAPLGAQWLTPEGYLYVRVDCDEEAA